MYVDVIVVCVECVCVMFVVVVVVDLGVEKLMMMGCDVVCVYVCDFML